MLRPRRSRREKSRTLLILPVSIGLGYREHQAVIRDISASGMFLFSNFTTSQSMPTNHPDLRANGIRLLERSVYSKASDKPLRVNSRSIFLSSACRSAVMSFAVL